MCRLLRPGAWAAAIFALLTIPALAGGRLNRAEYSNTVRDLTGVTLPLTQSLPPDDSGYGFDNISDVLSLSPALLERYFATAQRITSNPDVQKNILACGQQESGCARRLLGALARKAYRRPVKEAELKRLLAFVKQARREGDTLENGILLAVRAILVSPQFLLRNEGDPGSEIALASRLSYFLWSSMPDEELLGLAEKGSLRATLAQQVRRMLADPKSAALTTNFAAQWLEFRNVNRVQPDRKTFPDFDRELRVSMARETSLFFDAVVREDRSIFDFIDADFTFLNERLARHYGIEGVTGPEFRRVQLEGTQRGGLLTQASILTVTSYPTRTSPVLRGKFLLANILNAPPPAPPPGIPPLAETSADTHTSVRQQMEAHRANPVCATCHARMDPLGFALENYNATGRWRANDGETPIDASAVLPDGRRFSGPAELRTILKSQPDAFRNALGSKLLIYALGRGLDAADQPALQSIRERLASNGDRFSALVLGVIESAPFQAGPSERAGE